MDSIYADPALIPLYDIVNGGDHDHAFYRSRLPPAPAHVVDLGCGTGRFAMDLARRGYTVTAVDPAPLMIDFARTKAQTRAVRWIVGTAADLPPDLEADAVTMMGHAFQCLLTDRAVEETFAPIRSGLREGGRFLFESRNPAAKAWQRWTGRTGIPLDERDQSLTVDRAVLSAEGEFVTFEEAFHLSDGTRVSRSTLRFPPMKTITDHLRRAGFAEIEVFGDWDGSPCSADSPEMIFTAA